MLWAVGSGQWAESRGYLYSHEGIIVNDNKAANSNIEDKTGRSSYQY
jgi:hypothetical protein